MGKINKHFINIFEHPSEEQENEKKNPFVFANKRIVWWKKYKRGIYINIIGSETEFFPYDSNSDSEWCAFDSA